MAASMVVLDCFPDFKCIGPDCPDSCCQGWEVPIDSLTREKYRRAEPPPVRGWLESSLAEETSNPSAGVAARIRLTPDYRCSFWASDGWCSIQKKLGEGFLSCTCARYPREVSVVDVIREKSLLLSCPEAARLVLLRPEGLRLSVVDDPGDGFPDLCHRMLKTLDLAETESHQLHFWKVRTLVLNIVQNRELEIFDRLIVLGSFCRRLQELVDAKLFNLIPQRCDEFESEYRAPSSKQALRAITPDYAAQCTLLRAIFEGALGSAQRNARYLECLKQCREGLGLDSSDIETFTERYRASAVRWFHPFCAEHAYLFENLTVNSIFRTLFPFEPEKPVFVQYLRLVLHIALIKLHLIGLSAYHGGLTVALAVRLIQGYSKTFEASQSFQEGLTKVVEAHGLKTLAHMALLLKLDGAPAGG